MSGAPIPNETGPTPHGGGGAEGFIRRMLDPRATYNETEPKAGRGWWALLICGLLIFGLLSLIALIAVRRDKKFLKQMALTIFYVNALYAALAMLIGMTVTGNIDLAFGLILSALLSIPGILFGFIIAAYAQRKIDRLPMS